MRKRSLRTVVALAVALLLIAPSAALPKPRKIPIYLVTKQASYMSTDGQRYMIYGNKAEGQMGVIDTQTNRYHTFSYDPACTVVADYFQSMSFGNVILACPEDKFFLADVKTNTTLALPADFQVGGEVRQAFYGTPGREWIRGVINCPVPADFDLCTAVFLNFHTSEKRIAEPPRSEPYRDLDNPGLPTVTACSPWQRVALSAFSYTERFYEPPFLLQGLNASHTSFNPLIIARCGSEVSVVADRGPIDALSTTLSEHIITYTRSGGRVVYGANLKRGITYKLPLPDVKGVRRVVSLHTRNSIFIGAVLAQDQRGTPTRMRIYEARLNR